MNPILPFVPAACTSSDWSPGLYPDHMLSELLALREKMIMQLRLERLDAVIIANFLMGVIDQHEKPPRCSERSSKTIRRMHQRRPDWPSPTKTVSIRKN